ncbi:MAG: helix-turn-helix domain-containing protein [Bdellovibrionales bacterium]|nr:helix-turn-helix domain-containing protein [Bdellovibrionales bacterium]
MANVRVLGVEETPEFFENRIVREWLSTQDAASYLGVTPNALRILVCRGKVRSYKLGRRLKFHLRDLKSLLLPKGGR